jgi:single-stranded-DNA-specific exonuclease
LETRWFQKILEPEKANELHNTLRNPNGEELLPLIVVNMMISRGISTTEEAFRYLKPRAEQFHDPYLMNDMQKAVDRINLAIEKNQKIKGYFDYDADGVTTASLAKKAFALLDVDIDVFAPNRFTDGYGLNPKNMKKFRDECDLIITGDTGIRAFEGVLVASSHVDVIVTDHHDPMIVAISDIPRLKSEGIVPANGVRFEQVGERVMVIPDAYAIVNPKRIADPYPCKSLSGVAVLFKLFQAVFRSRGLDERPLLKLLDIVATGLVADLVHQIDVTETETGRVLDFEVRVMTYYGLLIMNQAPSVWVQAMREIQGIKGVIDSSHLGFSFGPMLNAPGRLEDPLPSIEFLLAADLDEALEKGRILKSYNDRRKVLTQEATVMVMEELSNEPAERSDYAVAVRSHSFHKGIAGLIAGMLCEKYYRPAIALSFSEKNGETVLTGSARSIEGVHILDVLTEVQDIIGKFEHGGHEQAAGLTLKLEQFDAFCKAFRDVCKKYDTEVFIPLKKFDMEIDGPDVVMSLLRKMAMLEPVQNNQKPVFCLRNAKIEQVKPVKEGKGAIYSISHQRNVLKAIDWNRGETWIPMYQERLEKKKQVIVDLLFTLEINSWNNQETIQLKIEDMKFID